MLIRVDKTGDSHLALVAGFHVEAQRIEFEDGSRLLCGGRRAAVRSVAARRFIAQVRRELLAAPDQLLVASPAIHKAVRLSDGRVAEERAECHSRQEHWLDNDRRAVSARCHADRSRVSVRHGNFEAVLKTLQVQYVQHLFNKMTNSRYITV